MQCSCGARAAPARRSSCPGRCPSICTGCRSCRARPPPTARRSTTGYARSAPCLPCAARRRRAASGSASRRREAPPASAATLPWCARASRARAWLRGRVPPRRPQAAAAGRRGCSWRPCCSCRPCGTSARAAARRAAARAGAAAWVWKAAESIGDLGRAPLPRRSLPWALSGLAARPGCAAQPGAWRVGLRRSEEGAVAPESSSTSCTAGSRHPRAPRRRATQRGTHPPSAERRPPPRAAARRAEVPCEQWPRPAPTSSG